MSRGASLARARTSLAAALLAATAVVTGPLAPGATPDRALAGGAYADPSFREQVVVAGLTHPVSVRFASDGRLFVAEKEGLIKAFDSLADATPTTVVDLRADVTSYWDRGLLGLAVDPAFLDGRPYLYVYYVYDAPPGGTAPTWSDGCPNPPGGTTDGCVVTSKVERITVNPATNTASARTELVHDWCQQFPSHSGGGIAIGPDGQLYVGGGEGAAFTGGPDYGNRGGTLPDPVNRVTPVNPCGDPVIVTSPAGAVPVVDPATAEGGMLRSQDLRTTGDPVGLSGTLIRVDPDTGTASAGNPLAAQADANARRIVAHGLRNPFRLAFRPGTSEVYVADVGASGWEEIERLVPTSGARTPTTMPNFGWPCYEGPSKVTAWTTMGNALCGGLYAAGASAVTAPAYAYSHVGSDAPCGASGYSGSAVSGLAFYDRAAADQTPYPTRFDGALFFIDYARNCLAALRPASDGTPDPSRMEVVGTGLGNPVDLVAGPHGDLYYPDLDGGRIVRVRYVNAPVAVASATPGTFMAPGTVTLDGSASEDPDPHTELVAWDWDLDHDGAFGGAADLSGKTVDWAITTPAIYPVTLRVTNSDGITASTELEVDAADDPPIPSVTTPAAGLTWHVGQEITFSGGATDAQDGVVAASGLTWDVVMHHCADADCHVHLVQTFAGVASGSFLAPDHEYPSYLELRLTATDADGRTGHTSVELQPQTTALTLDSTPGGIALAVNAAAKDSPSQTTLIRAGAATVSAPLEALPGGVHHRFSAWSDNGERTHEVRVDDPATLTATYVTDAAGACDNARRLAKQTWLADYASGEADEDWFRFTLDKRRTVRVTIGDLPVPGRMELYGACGTTRLALSDRGGTGYEQLTRTLAAGTYRVRVVFPVNARSPQPYVVQAHVLNGPIALTSATPRRVDGALRVAGEVMNLSGRTVGRIAVTATFRNASGAIVGKLTGSSFAVRLGNGRVTPFVLTGTVPAYATVDYTFAASSPVSARKIVLRSLTATANPNGTVTESGRFRNDGRTTASSVAAARTWYGRRGEVLEVRTTLASPSRLAPGASGRFTILRPALTGVQGARTQARAW